MKELRRKSIFAEWLMWHFHDAPVFLLSAWANYLAFALDHFSIPLLLQTLFAPWHRLTEGYPKRFDIGGFFSTFIANLFSRIIGAICRVILIITGIAFFSLTFVVGFVLFLLWLLLPVLFIGSIVFALLQ